MKKILLFLGIALAAQASYSQYYYIPSLNAGMNPGGVNPDGENPYPSTFNTGWSGIWNGSGTSSLEYTSEQNIPFAFKFNGNSVTKYTAGNFGVVSFDAGTPSTKPSGYSNVTLPSSSIPDNSVCVLGIKPQSVTSQGTTYNSAIMTKTYGTAPYRQHWIWFNFFSEANISQGWTYWAVVLEETTNNIYIVDMKTLCVSNGSLCNNNVKLSAGIQISSTEAYSISGSPNLGAQQITQNIFTSADNGYYTFVPGNQPSYDLTGKSVTIKPYLMLADAPFSISGTFMNNGTNKVTAADLNYSIDGGETVTGAVSGASLLTFETKSMTHPTKWTPTAIGKYTIRLWASNINGNNDENGSNDTTMFVVNVVDNFAQRNMLNEIFTSSTCGPCVAGNANYKNVVIGKSNHSTIKYQVNFPGTGDPYCTQEVRDRMNYYMPSNASVPRMEIDGGWDQNASSFTSNLYSQYESDPAFVDIAANVTINWQYKVTADITIKPLADFSSNNLKLFAVITEGQTYKNKKSNGETEFDDVMKKMMPSSTGFALSPLTKEVDVNKVLEHTFMGGYRLPSDGSLAQHINHTKENSIETWDDLNVVVFIQDATTKKVLQSKSFPVAVLSVESTESNVLVYPNPSSESFQITSNKLIGQNANVLVTNMQGQEIYNGKTANGQLSVNTAEWTAGVYLVSVKSSGLNFNTKVVVRH